MCALPRDLRPSPLTWNRLEIGRTPVVRDLECAHTKKGAIPRDLGRNGRISSPGSGQEKPKNSGPLKMAANQKDRPSPDKEKESGIQLTQPGELHHEGQ